MRKFQKIKAYENEQLFENKLANENKEVITIDQRKYYEAQQKSKSKAQWWQVKWQ